MGTAQATSMAISSAYSYYPKASRDVPVQDILNDNILSKDMAELMRLLIRARALSMPESPNGRLLIRAILDRYVTS